MAAVSASPAHHYIRTIHTSFTAAHSSPWARTSAHASPLLSSNHANLPLYASQPLGGPVHHVHSTSNSQPLKQSSVGGGRRRAYAFRAPTVAAPVPRTKGAYKFDPFADEPTTPVPTLSTLASLSVPPPAPKLSHASLPAPRRPQSPSGLYNHQLHQQQQVQHRRSTGYHHHQAPQPRRQPASFDVTGSTEIWRGFSAPLPKARTLAYEFEEYDDAPSSAAVPLLNTPLKAAAPVARRSTPSTLNPASPVFTPSRPLARTPSPPTPAPAPTFAATRSSMLNDKDAKARLVAGILLNRVHIQKPNRRRPVVGENKRPYVPSGLRSVVTVEA